MDVLSNVLQVVRLTGTVIFTAELSEPWSFASPPTDILLNNMPKKAECISLFHIIIDGKCLVKTETGMQFSPEKGNVLIFPNGVSHRMCSHLSIKPANLLELISLETVKNFSYIKYGGKGSKTRIICGYLLCDQRFNPLLSSLPDALILISENEQFKNIEQNKIELPVNATPILSDSWLNTTLKQMIEEVLDEKTGSATMVARLTELVFIEVLRRYMNGLPETSKGWFAGLRDPQVGMALKYLHSQPELKWNVEQLASIVGVSRSTFAQRFTDLIGESPIKYLTNWRIQLAKNLLLQPNLSIAMVAEKVGYDSFIAFHRAFKRHVGIPPVSWRDQMLEHEYK